MLCHLIPGYFLFYHCKNVYMNIHWKADKDLIHIAMLKAYHSLTCHRWQWFNYLQIYYKCGNIGLWKRCSNLQEKKMQIQIKGRKQTHVTKDTYAGLYRYHSFPTLIATKGFKFMNLIENKDFSSIKNWKKKWKHVTSVQLHVFIKIISDIHGIRFWRILYKSVGEKINWSKKVYWFFSFVYRFKK